MPKHYVTFGQGHAHWLNNQVIDHDCVAVYEAKDYVQGRNVAFELFGDKFFTDYHDEDWNDSLLHYFPKGYITLDL